MLATLLYPYVNNRSTSHPIKGKTKWRNESFSWLIHTCPSLPHLNPNCRSEYLPSLCFGPVHGHFMASSVFLNDHKTKMYLWKNTTDTPVLSCSGMSDSLWPHGLELARLLCLWGVRGSSRPRDQAQISCTAGRFFTSWVIVCLKKVRSIPQTFLFALCYHYFRHFHFFPCASTRPYTKQTRDRYVREKME